MRRRGLRPYQGRRQSVERAIRDSGLGLNPITDGTTLRIPLPELNEQRRKELVKIAKEYAENARVAARIYSRQTPSLIPARAGPAILPRPRLMR